MLLIQNVFKFGRVYFTEMIWRGGGISKVTSEYKYKIKQSKCEGFQL